MMPRERDDTDKEVKKFYDRGTKKQDEESKPRWGEEVKQEKQE